jgi:hypothetical protein
MRKLTVSTLVTLDGVLQDPGGFGEIEQGGWSGPYFDDEALRFSLEHLLAADVFLLGREPTSCSRITGPRRTPVPTRSG